MDYWRGNKVGLVRMVTKYDAYENENFYVFILHFAYLALSLQA